MIIISALIGKNSKNQLFAAPLETSNKEKIQTIIEGGIINNCLLLNGNSQCVKVKHVTLNYWDIHNLIIIEKGFVPLSFFKANGNPSSEKFAETLLINLNNEKYQKLTTRNEQHLLKIGEYYFQILMEETFKLDYLTIIIPKYLMDETSLPNNDVAEKLSFNLKKIQKQYKIKGENP